MKIVAGEFGGRIIKVPKIPHIRPSTEKTREAIFSALGDDVIDANVADLFCGSGALGLEALSRGAKSALFIDSSRAATAVVRQNILSLGLESRSRVMTMNALNLRPSHLEHIGIIFADPPYKMEYADRLVTLLSLRKFGWRGILVLEHEPKWRYDGERFMLVRRLEYGDTAISFLLGPNDNRERTTSDG
jgi:16S rRNA (guanine966-N2)-methyltransferase